MTTDNIPQTEQVSKTEPVSPEAKVETQKIEVKPEQTPQPLTKDQIQQLITEQVDLAKRQLQSEKDRAVNEIKREADRKLRLAESRARAYESTLENAGDDLRPVAETAKAKAETQYYKEFYDQTEQERQVTRYREQFLQSLKEEVVALGIDPNDKTIDYAEDAPDYFTGRKRFTESTTKILKAREVESEKKLDDRLKQFETEFRKKHGLDSQDTTSATGVVNQSDADFMTAFGNGSLPVNKANLTRYEELKKKYY